MNALYPSRMATYASRPAWELRARSIPSARVAVPLGLGLLVGLSLLLRTGQMGAGFWIDEGLSVGIADRPLGEIPGALRLDGSPPVFYSLLHFWLGLAGRGESATHTLSLIIALVAIPVAWWGARSFFGGRAGWIAAALAALNPFLTQYAQETRMYALIILLGLVACTCFLRTFAGDDARPARGWPVAFALALAAMLYTHNWTLFFAAASGIAWLVLVRLSPPALRRRRLLDGLLAFGMVLVLYLPWVPTLLFQTAHTGAPWAERPNLRDLLQVPALLLGATGGVVLLLAGGTGFAAVFRTRRAGQLDAASRAVVALAVLAVGTAVIAWVASEISPAWANRYLAVSLAPFLLLAAAGLAAARGVGLAGLALVALLWAFDAPPAQKSNARDLVAGIAPSLAPGDVVVSTQPEQVPVLHYYLPPGLRYATLWGPVSELGVTDWRDGVERMRATSARKDLKPILDSLAPGHRLVLIRPIIYNLGRWQAPWTEQIRLRSEQWNQYVSNDRRFRVTAIEPPSAFPKRPHALQATVLLKTRA